MTSAGSSLRRPRAQEGSHVDGPGPADVGHQQLRHEEPAEGEEHLDPEEAAARPRQVEVVGEHGQYRQTAQAVQPRGVRNPEPGACHAVRVGSARTPWPSPHPLVPLGPHATGTVQDLPVPQAWITDNREGGVFGVIGRVSIRAGRKTGTLLGRAHPGAVWLEWTA